MVRYWMKLPMRNVFLCVPSLFREDSENIEYPLFYSPETKMQARHTNMPIFYSISDHLMKKGEQIDAVFLLSSKEVINDRKKTELGDITTLEYIQKKFSSYQEKFHQTSGEVVSVNIPSGELRNTSAIQGRIDEQIRRLDMDSHTKIWVDFTSGQRSYAILLVFLLRFLELSNCGEIAEILYAKLLSDKRGKIESCLAVYRLFDRYGLLERIGDISRGELIEYVRESDNQKKINQAFSELNETYHKMRTEILNTSGNTSEVFAKARKQAQAYAEEYSDVPMICELAKRIQETFSEKESVLASTEYLLEIGMPGLALIKLRENAFRYLIESEVVITKHSAAVIEAEIVSADRYYNTFIEYMRGCLNQLLKNSRINPKDIFTADEDTVLRERYERNAYKEYEEDEVAQMNDAVLGSFREKCAHCVERLQLDFAQEIYAISQRENAPHSFLKEYDRIRKKYNEKEQRFKHIYQKSGFPLPCFNLTGSYYYHFYQTYLISAAYELIKLVNVKWNKWKIPDNFKYICLAETDVAQLDYYETINLCIQNLRKVVPLKFSGQSECGQGWTCGLKDESELQAFFVEFLNNYHIIRKQRNDYAHPDETRMEKELELSMEEKKDLVTNCVQLLKCVASKERR